MSCRFDENLLYEYVDGTIDELSKIFLEEHLKYCKKCQSEIEMIKLMDSKIKETFESDSTPEKLQNFVDLIIDNCMLEEEKEDITLSFKNYTKDMNEARKAIFKAYSNSYKNPYNEAVNGLFMFPIKETQKALGKYVTKKIPVISKIKKILRVG